jgi:hypothetical protein
VREVLAGDAVASRLVVPVRGATVGIESVRITRVSVELFLRIFLKLKVVAVEDVPAAGSRRSHLFQNRVEGPAILRQRGPGESDSSVLAPIAVSEIANTRCFTGLSTLPAIYSPKTS